MTESSSYDAAPPVPPAYGIWRRIGPDRFEAGHELYPTSTQSGLEDLTTGGGRRPAGRGMFTETIAVAGDRATLTSTIIYEAFDEAAEPVEGAATPADAASGCSSDAGLCVRPGRLAGASRPG